MMDSPTDDDPTTDSAPRVRLPDVSARGGGWHLHVLVSPDATRRHHAWRLGPGTTVLGREPDGQQPLAIDDRSLSRAHLLIEHTNSPDGVTIRDLGSRNGTFLDGRRVHAARAGQGGVVRFGRTVAVLEYASLGLEPENDGLDAEVPGASVAARRVRDDLRYAASTLHPVLMQGPTGTGKEHAAAAIHRLSVRKGPLVRVNVAAIPDTLVEATLFGHERGAFTGARDAQKGRLREADGGTLVLDEIGELPLHVQPKLLRALEEGCVRPVGGARDVPANLRIIACTNANLDSLVESGRFRRDLAARLRVHHVRLPPIPERRPDLFALADAVQPPPDGLVAAGFRSWAHAIEPEVAEALLLHPWPDGLRELRAVLVHLVRDVAALLQQQDPAARLGLASLPASLHAWALALFVEVPSTAVRPLQPSEGEDPPRHGRPELLELLRQEAGNVEGVARRLGVHRRQVYRWLSMAGIDRRVLMGVRRDA